MPHQLCWHHHHHHYHHHQRSHQNHDCHRHCWYCHITEVWYVILSSSAPEKCQVPGVVNGTIIGEQEGAYTDHGKTLQYHCNRGHQRNTTEGPKCYNGTWTFYPKCIPGKHKPMTSVTDVVSYFRGESSGCRLFSTASTLEWLRKLLPHHSQGSSTERCSRNTPRVVIARVFYVLRGSLTSPFIINNSVRLQSGMFFVFFICIL